MEVLAVVLESERQRREGRVRESGGDFWLREIMKESRVRVI